jgi:hypothetical protein
LNLKKLSFLKNGIFNYDQFFGVNSIVIIQWLTPLFSCPMKDKSIEIHCLLYLFQEVYLLFCRKAIHILKLIVVHICFGFFSKHWNNVWRNKFGQCLNDLTWCYYLCQKNWQNQSKF